ncbi:MAG: signal recognition particle-docking protein FtsY [Deltaproteobacteria bacterium]|nr:signal recognition particle-docking protein FtsY [Deltaproteobacteria bacterium]MBW1855288.1 signal recognition particle-docking protein FtsY [Deltaproteobacteria bacterium]MBW2183499.1 signal recognition particle-docking protein FtsY [Deltaproteobacteria bacterium]
MSFSFFKNKNNTPAPQPGKEQSEGKGFIKSLNRGLAKTHEILTIRIDDLILGKKEIDHDFIEELEEILISSDLGVKTSHKLIEQVQAKVKRGEADKPELVKRYLKECIYNLLVESEQPLSPSGEPPFVIMVIGINGTGKTTTIAKMAHHYTSAGKKVLLVAADTFRAAAIEQLEVWSKRVDCAFMKQSTGSDPSAVVYDALQSSKKRGIDIVIIDTAGRMHTKKNLMEELKKIKRVTGREHPGAPHETLLVIDATTGQNALSQVELFQEAIDITGIALTKLDGTSKGGIIIAISNEFNIPLRYIGTGENFDDLKQFKAREFVDALLD